MFETASTRIQDALKEIEIMKETGEKIRTLPWATYDKEEDNTLFVSSDPKLLRFFDYIIVDGMMYYIGFKKIQNKK